MKKLLLMLGGSVLLGGCVATVSPVDGSVRTSYLFPLVETEPVYVHYTHTRTVPVHYAHARPHRPVHVHTPARPNPGPLVRPQHGQNHRPQTGPKVQPQHGQNPGSQGKTQPRPNEGQRPTSGPQSNSGQRPASGPQHSGHSSPQGHR